MGANARARSPSVTFGAAKAAAFANVRWGDANPSTPLRAHGGWYFNPPAYQYACRPQRLAGLGTSAERGVAPATLERSLPFANVGAELGRGAGRRPDLRADPAPHGGRAVGRPVDRHGAPVTDPARNPKGGTFLARGGLLCRSGHGRLPLHPRPRAQVLCECHGGPLQSNISPPALAASSTAPPARLGALRATDMAGGGDDAGGGEPLTAGASAPAHHAACARRTQPVEATAREPLAAAQAERKAKLEAGRVDTVCRPGDRVLRRTQGAARRRRYWRAALTAGRSLRAFAALARPSPDAYTLALPCRVRSSPAIDADRLGPFLERSGHRPRLRPAAGGRACG